ncbi:glucosylglycerol-phosphate synthase [Ferrovibrio sp.]|uniref:glucosylglycerol-phosphate synthase n=1 Tax=Ferrovibrio sp. TaxID=1917215 RepID=UPI00311EE68E
MTEATQTDAKDRKNSFVIVYHRQPYEEVTEGGKTIYRENKSPNGVVPALKGFFSTAKDACWVAWKQSPAPGKAMFQRRIHIEDSYGSYDVVRLPLTAEQVKSFYHVTSKEAFWPILHSFPWLFNYDAVDWDTFCEVNRLFAEAACEQATDDAFIWVHDYNLWLVPHYVRRMKPNARIAFFHHTPFPAPDVFNVVPWRKEILDSLLKCDIVGFHIPRYAENFASLACSLAGAKRLTRRDVEGPFNPTGAALSEPEVTTELTIDGRRVEIDAWPIGTNPEVINKHLSTFEAGGRVADIKNQIGERRLLLSVGRVDYTKGTKQMLEAFDRLLARRPELRGKVQLFCVAVAAADGMTVYRAAQREIERLVGAINGRYGNLSWTPILLSTRPVPFDELLCYYSAADVCWITPLRDGLNLVAKEFVAAQNGEPGALILSEFTGASVEFPEAVSTNPYSAASMDAAIDVALDMSREERESRMESMRRRVNRWDVNHWAHHVQERFAGLGAKRDSNGGKVAPLKTDKSGTDKKPAGKPGDAPRAA